LETEVSLPPERDPEVPFQSAAEFTAKREEILNLALEGNVMNQTTAGKFGMRLIGDRAIDRIYRSMPEKRLEDDVGRLLPAYSETDLLVEWHLNAVREWALRRYAFCLAAKVNDRLNRYVKGERLWLAKDFALPRMGFAMMMGYGAMLGAGRTVDWLGEFGVVGFWIVLGLCALAIWGLVHVNVRSQIGRNRKTIPRTAWVFAIIAGWVALGVSGIAVLSAKAGTFRLGWAVLSSAVAMLLGILGQFFFTGNKSMAEPL
jgi:hypothetical protein